MDVGGMSINATRDFFRNLYQNNFVRKRIIFFGVHGLSTVSIENKTR